MENTPECAFFRGWQTVDLVWKTTKDLGHSEFFYCSWGKGVTSITRECVHAHVRTLLGCVEFDGWIICLWLSSGESLPLHPPITCYVDSSRWLRARQWVMRKFIHIACQVPTTFSFIQYHALARWCPFGITKALSFDVVARTPGVRFSLPWMSVCPSYSIYILRSTRCYVSW